MNRTDLLHDLATTILGLALPYPTRVAIDGVDAAGKTTLANEIAAVLKTSSRQIIRASIDGFHNPKHIRRRDDSAEGYFRTSFNYQALRDDLLTPLGPNGSRLFHRATFDFRVNAAVVAEREPAAPDAILLLDGVFLLRTELRAHWDLSIFVEADFETTVARAQVRDRELFGDAAAVRQRYESRYIPGQRLYLEQEQPRQFADIVVFNNDFSNPRLERAAQPVAQRGRPACCASPAQRAAGQLDTLGSTMNIRRARESEAATLSALAFDSKQYWGYSPQDIEQWLPGLIVSSHDIASKPTFVADIKSEVVGFYLLTPKPQAWELDHLWVAPKFMRRGIGRALLAHAAISARLAGISSIVIDSDPNAEPFYVACGATRQGVVAAPSSGNPGRFRPQFALHVDIHAT